MVESVGEGVTTVEVGDHVIPCYAVRPSSQPVPCPAGALVWTCSSAKNPLNAEWRSATMSSPATLCGPLASLCPAGALAWSRSSANQPFEEQLHRANGETIGCFCFLTGDSSVLRQGLVWR